MFKNKKIILITAAAIIILGCFGVYLVATKKKAPEYVTAPVMRGKLVQSVEATGKVKSAERIQLNFKTSGRIAKIYVVAGDKVTSGQILAQLESQALSSKVTDARARLQQAQADYDKLLAGASDADVTVSQKSVDQKQSDLIAAENDLANLHVKRDTELNNLEDTAVATMNSEVLVAKTALNEIDNTLNDEDAGDTLSVKNLAVLNIAKDSRRVVGYTVDKTAVAVSQANISSDSADILQLLDQVKQMLDSVKSALTDTLNVLSATISSYQFSESALNTLKDNILSQQGAINTSQSNIQTAKANLTNKIASYQDQVNSAQDSVNKARTALQVAQAQLDLKKSPPRQFEIDAQEAQVRQAEAALNLALANLAEAIIRAPLAGTITKKNFEMGEQVSMSGAVLEMIGNVNLEIEVDIPESDVIKVKNDQAAEITLDAFPPEQKFIGQVFFIDPAETLVQDVVYYKVKVKLNDINNEVKPGMTANVTIFTAEKDGVLSIPFRAIKSRDGERYVEILINNQSQERTVGIGLRGDEGVEILSGLQEGEQVITFTKE